MTGRLVTLAGLVLGLLQACGCGYTMVQSHRLFGAERVTVMPFFEETPANMSGAVAQHMSRLLSAGGMRVVGESASADALLDGTITMTTQGSATLYGVRTFQVGARVQARLLDTKGAELWRHSFDVTEDFLPTEGSDTQPVFTETNRRSAIYRLAERAARTLHEQMVTASTLSQRG